MIVFSRTWSNVRTFIAAAIYTSYDQVWLQSIVDSTDEFLMDEINRCAERMGYTVNSEKWSEPDLVRIRIAAELQLITISDTF